MNHTNLYAERRLGFGQPIAPAARVGMGDVPTDLAAFNQFISTGDKAQGMGLFDPAVVSYQEAGQFGADTLGPEIDAQTGGVSKPLTGQAWDINTNLAAVRSAAATQSDAQNAQGFARQIQNLYQTAVSLPPASAGGGASTPSSALASLAQNLVSYLQTNGCTTSSVQPVLDFQRQYNTEGQVHLAEDGKYGRGTHGALQRVLDTSGIGGTAPASCFASPPRKPSTTPGGGTTPPLVASASMMPWGTIAIAGAAVAGAAAIAYAVHKKKGGRGIGHHVGRHMHRGMRRLRRTRNPLVGVI